MYKDIKMWKNSKILTFFSIVLPIINIIYLILLFLSKEKIKKHLLSIFLWIILNFSYVFFIFLDNIEDISIEWYYYLLPFVFIYYFISEKFNFSQQLNYIIYFTCFLLISIIPTLIALFFGYWDDCIFEFLTH